MRRIICVVLSCMIVFGTVYVHAEATGAEAIPYSDMGIMASGSFSLSVAPYGRSQADKTFPLEAGETVSISAVYSPENASVDFGLVDPDGVFHYFTVTDGGIDETIQVDEAGHYRLAVRNNSNVTIRVTGFVNY